MSTVEPLKARTMSLAKLQLATLDLIRKTRFQLGRQAHEEGMSDGQFIDEILEPLEQQIYADRVVIRASRTIRG